MWNMKALSLTVHKKWQRLKFLSTDDSDNNNPRPMPSFLDFRQDELKGHIKRNTLVTFLKPCTFGYKYGQWKVSQTSCEEINLLSVPRYLFCVKGIMTHQRETTSRLKGHTLWYQWKCSWVCMPNMNFLSFKRYGKGCHRQNNRQAGQKLDTP